MTASRPIRCCRSANLSVTFRSEAGLVTAVRSLSYEVRPGELRFTINTASRSSALDTARTPLNRKMKSDKEN